MKILMISIDRGLLGKNQLGDVIERHAEYGRHVTRLDIIVFAKKGSAEYQIADNVKSYPTNSLGKIWFFLDAKRIGRKLFQDNHYDLIIAQDPFLTGLVGSCLKKKFGAKLLVHFHGDFWQNKNWLKESKLNWLFLLISKWVARRADGFRVMSQGQKEKLLKAGIKEEKIRVISTPVDLEKYKAIKTELPRIAGRFILHVGRDDKVKDYPTLIKAFKIVNQELPEVKLVQAGADQEVKKAVAVFEVNNVEPLGQLKAGELVNLYQQTEVVVLSSTSESFGKVIVEANASGKPVVSTATTGAKEIIQDGFNGFLVPIGDSQKLAQKILYLLKNQNQAIAIGQNGQKLMQERFSDNTKKIIDFWQAVAKI